MLEMPNDVLINGAKIAGILWSRSMTQSSWESA